MPTIHEAMALAFRLGQAGNLQAAEQIYLRIVEVDPTAADAWRSLAAISHQLGQPDLAIQRISRWIELRPASAEAHFALGNILKDQRALPESIAAFQQAIAIAPDYAEAHYNLGNSFAALDRWAPAADCYSRAIQLRPNLAAAYTNLGLALGELYYPSDVVASYHQQAITLNPHLAEAYSNLGSALKDFGRLDDSIAAHRRALELNPNSLSAHSSLLYTLYFCPNIDAAALAAEHRRWNQQHAEPLKTLIQPHTNDPSPSRRLRIGYVSPNFLSHCQSLFTLPLFRSHDHANFEICCYSDVFNSDETTAQLRSHADLWQDITPLSDEQVARQIRHDQIDILVDLTMHMARGRPLVVARQPAPVQVCWLAYPGTTGISTIDYRLTDPYLDPPGLFDHHYSEQSIRLPNTFWCYDPQINLAISPLSALDRGYVTFGNLNNPCKLNPGVLKLWSRVLKAVNHSRLTLLIPTASQRDTTLRLFEQEGLTADRLTFLDRQPREKYLESYHHIDIGLDTVPYNGHTTSLDAYWMGVPVVTLVGQTVVGRAGLSQLTNLGLPELIAHTPDQFVAIAASLAQNLPLLTDLRQTLRQKMQRSPLMNAPLFARHIESAYRQIWTHYCHRPPNNS